MNNTVENDFFGFPKVKWLHLKAQDGAGSIMLLGCLSVCAVHAHVRARVEAFADFGLTLPCCMHDFCWK